MSLLSRTALVSAALGLAFQLMACSDGSGDGDGSGGSCANGLLCAAGGKGGGGNAGAAGKAGASNGGSTGGGVGGAGGSGGSTVVNPSGSPVEQHGALKVVGPELHDASGRPVQLKGVSSMWLNWEDDGYAESLQALQWMRDNWKVKIIRAAMGIEPKGAYLESDATKAKATQQVERIVDNAIAAGMYVLIDWHDHNAISHRAEAIAFFQKMSQKYGSSPNVLYETFNEPLDVSWTSDLKPYHEAVVQAIRANDPDNVIILGTPNWCQDVDAAAASPLAGSNLMYTLHFYACTHRGPFIEKASAARRQGLPLFVTEWGATPADGGAEDQRVCESDAQAWFNWLNEQKIGAIAWKLDGCEDTSCLLKEGAPVDGGWTDQWLNGHAQFVRARLTE